MNSPDLFHYRPGERLLNAGSVIRRDSPFLFFWAYLGAQPQVGRMVEVLPWPADALDAGRVAAMAFHNRQRARPIPIQLMMLLGTLLAR